MIIVNKSLTKQSDYSSIVNVHAFSVLLSEGIIVKHYEEGNQQVLTKVYNLSIWTHVLIIALCHVGWCPWENMVIACKSLVEQATWMILVFAVLWCHQCYWFVITFLLLCDSQPSVYHFCMRSGWPCFSSVYSIFWVPCWVCLEIVLMHMFIMNIPFYVGDILLGIFHFT